MSENSKSIDVLLVVLCYAAGIGSILFAFLSGRDIRYYFVLTGVLSLLLAALFAGRTLGIHKIFMKQT